MVRLAALLAAFLLSCSASAADRATLDAMTLQVFLTTSGTFTKDVSAGGFGAWNGAVQGEGIPDGERFDAVLLTLRFTSAGEVYAKGPLAEVTVTDRKSKKIVRRERIRDVFIGPGGVAFLPIWLPNMACGPFEIVATGGGKRLTAALEAACGE